MAIIRHVVEAAQRQGIDETVVYTVDFTNWTTSPTVPRLAIWEKIGGVWYDRTFELCTTTAGTAAGAVITLPAISNLNEGHNYLPVVTVTAGTNILSCKFDLLGEK